MSLIVNELSNQVCICPVDADGDQYRLMADYPVVPDTLVAGIENQVGMVCPSNGFKVDLDNQPLTMTTRMPPTADAFAHKSAHYQSLVISSEHWNGLT